MFSKKYGQVKGEWISMGQAPGYWYSKELNDQFFPTHWKELPEDPKE